MINEVDYTEIYEVRYIEGVFCMPCMDLIIDDEVFYPSIETLTNDHLHIQRAIGTDYCRFKSKEVIGSWSVWQQCKLYDYAQGEM